MEKQELLSRLVQRANLAQSSKLARLIYTPFRYLHAIFFRKFIYGINKKGKRAIAKTFFDLPMQVILPAGMDLYLLGAKAHDSEIRLTKFLIQQLKKGDVFIDVGTHFGYYSLLAATLVGKKGKVIGIEASAAIFALYADNVKQLDSIHPLHLAATAENGSIAFYEFPILYSEYNTLNPEQFEKADWLVDNPYQEIHVEGKQLDRVLEKFGDVPQVIKIDVEGAELEVIKGLKQTLTEASPIIAMEYLADDRDNRAHKKAATMLEGFGYKTYLISAEGNLVGKTILEIDRFLKATQLESDNIVFKK